MQKGKRMEMPMDGKALNEMGEDSARRPGMGLQVMNVLLKANNASQQATAVYRQYMQNTVKTEEIQARILKGAQRDADPCDLLFMACDTISIMTGDGGAFYDNVRRAMEKP